MRISKKDLESSVDLINELTNSPLEPYTKQADGKLKANIGNFHLSGAYGGWNVMRIVNDAGGCEEPLNHGHISKKELYIMMRACIKGIQLKSEVNQ